MQMIARAPARAPATAYGTEMWEIQSVRAPAHDADAGPLDVLGRQRRNFSFDHLGFGFGFIRH
jgi:hypothetical protein